MKFHSAAKKLDRSRDHCIKQNKSKKYCIFLLKAASIFKQQVGMNIEGRPLRVRKKLVGRESGRW